MYEDEQLSQSMMDVTIEKDISTYFPEDRSTGNSSSETSNGQKTMTDKLSVQRLKMNEFLSSCDTGRVGPCRKRWEEASIRTKKIMY